MDIIDIKENEDGSATLEMNLTELEVKLLLELAINDILKAAIEAHNEKN